MNKAHFAKRTVNVGMLALVLQLGGCSFLQIGESEYSCKGMPDGVTCMSARDVYQITENENFRQQIEKDAALKKAVEEGEDGAEDQIAARATPSVAAGERYVIPRPAREPVPIRTQATVMRIWVAPWESAQGDLNVPGYIYTEIEPRRWEIGAPAPRPAPTIRPLESRQAAPAQ
ncbi:TPA: type IV conjugative transfer system lipoprotein TraV [Pseudomonas aeruginosa]|uniref:type IV conjugative transfer system lipoprotein TraV n=1 Tax=Pseudomonas aeruginosa TaxID=287 RepID=UPI000B5F7073|nr:type IV conjugative transfer system lipoprotein TraV [Pseudomonas aeruginosa]ASJ88545.1 type IV conjugative transfer system protein TraV [Pseudomonas aeruginosa]HDV6122856.1 type IV conjugative transfer system lipoprotein TraV [Pseudomonas aeruginosa]HDV6143734.1 type IV conjugative transfer system lipoprotein TraV [Pseudomonas aeruginosa]HDV6167194.1 type IV conjugative transfer system lipoprotein TraV [Pseudomonas aeruginosa]